MEHAYEKCQSGLCLPVSWTGINLIGFIHGKAPDTLNTGSHHPRTTAVIRTWLPHPHCSRQQRLRLMRVRCAWLVVQSCTLPVCRGHCGTSSSLIRPFLQSILTPSFLLSPRADFRRRRIYRVCLDPCCSRGWFGDGHRRACGGGHKTGLPRQTDEEGDVCVIQAQEIAFTVCIVVRGGSAQNSVMLAKIESERGKEVRIFLQIAR